MARKKDISDRILDAVLDLAPISGWRQLSMAEIVGEAGVSLDEAYNAFPSKSSLLVGLLTRVDQKVLAEGGTDLEETVRDRLFEVIMRRFDALGPHRNAIAAILRDLPTDPLTSLELLPRFANSMAWMLEAAGLSTSGFRGALRIKGFSLIYMATLRVWLSDDSEDQARTMAALDSNLKRAERWTRDAGDLCRCIPWKRRATGEAEAPPSSNGGVPAAG